MKEAERVRQEMLSHLRRFKALISAYNNTPRKCLEDFKTPADQPLLDAAEYVAPSLRTIYFNATEAATYEDARRYAERYRAEAERLNEIETKSRSQGTALADDVVAKMSSFVRSYGEMRRGEEFVMREVRSRARERLRWTAAPVMLALALLVAPGVLAFMRRKVERTRLAPGP